MWHYSGRKIDFEVTSTILEGHYNKTTNTIIMVLLWVMAGHNSDKGAGVSVSYQSDAGKMASKYWLSSNAARVRQRASGFYKENPETDIAMIQMTANQPTANSRLDSGSFDQLWNH